VVEHIASDPEQMLRALAAERLNSTEEALQQSTHLRGLGRSLNRGRSVHPNRAVFLFSGYTAVIISAVVSLLAHFAVGAAKSLVTVRSWWSSGFEMTLVGAVEGVVTYVIGLGPGTSGRMTSNAEVVSTPALDRSFYLLLGQAFIESAHGQCRQPPHPRRNEARSTETRLTPILGLVASGRSIARRSRSSSRMTRS
jgi:hypothetical protein